MYSSCLMFSFRILSTSNLVHRLPFTLLRYFISCDCIRVSFFLIVVQTAGPHVSVTVLSYNILLGYIFLFGFFRVLLNVSEKNYTVFALNLCFLKCAIITFQFVNKHNRSRRT